MAKSYSKIQKMIAKLQAEAVPARAREITGVIKRIRVAVSHYGLTADDIFGKARAKPAAPEQPEPGLAAKRKAPKAKVKAKSAKSAKAAKPANPPKYGDGAGHTWTGNGQRPGWFKDALANGKTADDLLIKP